jgi:hypothetical protein
VWFNAVRRQQLSGVMKEHRRISLPDMWDIIKLCNNTMPDIWSSKTGRLVYLWAEMAEDDDSGLILPEKDRSNEKFKIFHRFSVAACIVSMRTYRATRNCSRRIVNIKFQNYQVCIVGQMMRVAETKVCGVGAAHCAVCEFGGRVREY